VGMAASAVPIAVPGISRTEVNVIIFGNLHRSSP
jgi:hypothetical protein